MSVLVLPYNYTIAGGKPLTRKYPAIKTKANLTPATTPWDLSWTTGNSTTDGKSKDYIIADGFTYVSESEIYYTFKHTFKIPLNVIN